jgi:fatty-acyl-CoA synthase
LPSTLTALLAVAVRRVGDAPALYDRGRSIGYRTLEERARRLARGLVDLGIGPGDRVGVWLPNVPAWLELQFACARLGAIVVAVNTRFRGVEVEDILARSGAKVLVLWPGFKDIDFLGILEGLDGAVRAGLSALILYDEGDDLYDEGVDGPALPGAVRYHDLLDRPMLEADAAGPEVGCNIFTTSGTTKAPKFVLHVQRGIVEHARAVAPAFGYDAPDAVMLMALPLCGVFGYSQVMATLAAARPMVLMTVFDGAEAAALIDKHRVTHMNGSDEMYRRILEAASGPNALSALRHCGFAAFGGEAEALVAEGDRRGIPFVGLYGMSETQALYASQWPDAAPGLRVRPGGFPASPASRARVRDPETGKLLPDGEAGELELSGPSLMAGYYGDAAATAEAMTADGFVRTGDLGHLPGDGSFVFLTRMGDVLRLGGFLVNPEEISSHVETHAAVESCQVVGVDGPRGTVPAAFVIPVAGAAFSEDALAAHCAAGMAKFKVPRWFFPIDAFPVTESPNGFKIQRAKLRQMAAERTADG